MNTHSPHARLSVRELLEAVREDHRKLPKSPCYEQTREEIENYYRHEPVGSRAAVRQTQHGILCYYIGEIENRNRRRVYIRGPGIYGPGFYMKSGKNSDHPTGQTLLVVPTEAVVAWAEEHPFGATGYAVYYHSER